MASILRIVFLLGGAALSCVAAEFRGRLDEAVLVGTRAGGLFGPASPELVAQLPVAPPAGARVWAMPRQPIEIKGRVLLFALVETEPGVFTAWIDRDFDGRWSMEEQWAVPRGGEPLKIRLAWNNGIFAEFPFEFSIRRGGDDATSAPGYGYNFNVRFTATIDVEGRPLQLTFSPRPADSTIDLATTRIAMDANFNGKIDFAAGESANPSNRTAVFRVGSRYLAVKSVDVRTGEVVIEERPASDYLRFDARPGQEMPDFTFTTFEGTTRKLSDLRGKYVLLDIWGTWCGPCISEMKHLDPIYAKYAPRGFEVIGLNMEKTDGSQTPEVYAKDEEKVRVFLAKAGHKWIQATQRSIERFALDTIQVNSYPTCILVGPDGKVISREARGATIEKLLAAAFPAA